MKKNTNFKLCLLAFILFMTSMFIMRNSAKELENITNGLGIIDLTIGWNLHDVSRHLGALGEEGQEYYKNTFYCIDFIYPIMYGLFYSLTILYVSKIYGIKNKILNMLPWLPIIGLLFDWSENLIVISMLQDITNIGNLQITLFNIFNIGKFICIYISLFIIVSISILNVIKRIQKQLKKSIAI